MPVSETTDLIYDVTLHGLAWLLRSVNRGPAVFATYRMPNDCVLMLTYCILTGYNKPRTKSTLCRLRFSFDHFPF